MATASGKRARLEELSKFRAGLPAMSQSALAAVLQYAKQRLLPNGSRNEIRAARDAICRTETPYGPLIQDVPVQASADAQPEMFQVVHPAAWFHTISEFDSVQRLFQTALRVSGSNPLDLVVYLDEITPGSVVAHKQRRKSWCCYVSVLQFGALALTSEDQWHPKPVGMSGLLQAQQQ